jgi:hypothetical protein
VARLSSFYQTDSSRALQHAPLRHFINRTLQAELNLIRDALSNPTIQTAYSISHFIERMPLGTAFCDSSLHAAGGFSSDLRFWWYFEWPPQVKQRTLKFIKNNNTSSLIDINVLEYAALFITYLVYHHSLSFHPLDQVRDPHPVVLIHSGNSSSEAWAHKGAGVSFAGCALGRLQASLLMRNPWTLRLAHIYIGECHRGHPVPFLF